MKKVIFSAITLIFLFSGCAQNRYTQVDIGEIITNHKGTVVFARSVEIADDGGGAILGAIIGAIIGHQFGKGGGKTLATVTGALVGGAAGDRINQDLGQEITIELDNNQQITTIIRIDKKNPYWLKIGDRVIVYLKRGKIIRINPIFNERVE